MRKGSKKGSVLLPINYSANSTFCMRSLSRQGIHTVAVSERTDRPAFASRYCDEKILIPSPYEDLVAYKDALLTLAERSDIHTVIPTREVDSYVLGKYRDEFAEHVIPLWPTIEQIRTVHDRLQLAEVAEEADIPIPKTWSFDDVDDWDRRQIVKPRYSILTSDYIDSFSPSDFEFVKKILHLHPGVDPGWDRIRSEMSNHTPVVQEFVPIGQEYMFGALYDHGDPVMTYQQRYLRRKSYAGGGSVYRESVYNQRIDELGRKLLGYLDWHGLACVEFMWDKSAEELKLTEINPRTWSTLPTAADAGADFPYSHWLLATGQDDHIRPEYTSARGHFLYGELQFLESVWKGNSPLSEPPPLLPAIGDVLWSCIRYPHFDHLRLSDPLPFIRGLLNQI